MIKQLNQEKKEFTMLLVIYDLFAYKIKENSE